MFEVITLCFNHAGARCIQLSTNEKGKVTATLKPNTAESHGALYQQQQKRTLRYLSAPALKAIIDILLQNSYIQFQGVLVQQKKGIPMGISPAVFFAN